MVYELPTTFQSSLGYSVLLRHQGWPWIPLTFLLPPPGAQIRYVWIFFVLLILVLGNRISRSQAWPQAGLVGEAAVGLLNLNSLNFCLHPPPPSTKAIGLYHYIQINFFLNLFIWFCETRFLCVTAVLKLRPREALSGSRQQDQQENHP